MKRLLILVLTAFILTGCSTIQRAMISMSIGSSGSNSKTETSTPPEKSSEPKTEQTTPSTSTGSRVQMAPPFEFSMIYASSAIVGGINMSGGGEFPVGTGVTYKIFNSENGSSTTITKAKLAPGGSGSFWWSLRVQADEDTYYYEYQADRNGVIIKVRYRDYETKQIQEFVPESGSSYSEPNNQDYKDYIVGKEKITTTAGTFNTDKLVFDDGRGSDVLTYWATPSVPGGTVRYMAQDNSDGTTVKGELVSIEKGFKTLLNSY